MMRFLLLLMFTASLSFGQIAQIAQVATNTTSASTNMSGANLLVACITGYYADPCATPGSGGSTITDSQGNTWTQVGTSRTVGSTGHCIRYSNTASCSSPPCVSATHTFTISGGHPTIQVFGFSGAASSPVDTGIAASTTASSTSIQAGSVTPSVGGDVLLACVTGGGPLPSPSINSSFSTPLTGLSDNGSVRGAGSYYVQSTAGAINPTWSWSGSYSVAAGIAAFKKATETASVKRRLIQ
jgi:hypothetical protein